MTSKTPAWDAVRAEHEQRVKTTAQVIEPTADDEIGIGLGASVIINGVEEVRRIDDRMRESQRIAKRMQSIAEKHDGKTPAAVAEVVEMLREEGWHLELIGEEGGARQWAAQPNSA